MGYDDIRAFNDHIDAYERCWDDLGFLAVEETVVYGNRVGHFCECLLP